MSEHYLILHKVRGEVAFDVAIRHGDWWIVDTSGHRAYPLLWWPLSMLLPAYEGYQEVPLDSVRDHYAIHEEPRPKLAGRRNKRQESTEAALAALGLTEEGLLEAIEEIRKESPK